MIRIVRLKTLPGHRLWVRFNDGVEGIYDVEPERRGGEFERLRDPAVFDAAVVNEDFGCVEWPGGIDLCPESMHEEMISRSHK